MIRISTIPMDDQDDIIKVKQIDCECGCSEFNLAYPPRSFLKEEGGCVTNVDIDKIFIRCSRCGSIQQIIDTNEIGVM